MLKEGEHRGGYSSSARSTLHGGGIQLPNTPCRFHTPFKGIPCLTKKWGVCIKNTWKGVSLTLDIRGWGIGLRKLANWFLQLAYGQRVGGLLCPLCLNLICITDSSNVPLFHFLLVYSTAFLWEEEPAVPPSSVLNWTWDSWRWVSPAIGPTSSCPLACPGEVPEPWTLLRPGRRVELQVNFFIHFKVSP